MGFVQFHVADDRCIGVNTQTRADLLSTVESRLSAGLGFAVATLNVDHLVKLRRIDAFRRAYAAQTHVVADGNPVVWISRLARRPVELIPGCELVHPISAIAARRDVPVALLGSTERTLALASARLRRRHAGLKIPTCIAPSADFDPTGPEADLCIDRLRRSGARVCFLALGAPKQEIFAARARAVLPEVGFVSIGAGLDFIAGTQKRAPAWMRQLSLEWLWRAATNPRRLAGRYARCAMLLPMLTWDGMKGRSRPLAGDGLQEV